MATGNEAYDIVSDEEISSSVEAANALSDDVKQLQPQISNSGMSPGVKWCYKTTGVIVIFLVVMLAGMVTYVALRDDDVDNKDTVADKTTTTTKKPDPTVPPGDILAHILVAGGYVGSPNLTTNMAYLLPVHNVTNDNIAIGSAQYIKSIPYDVDLAGVVVSMDYKLVAFVGGQGTSKDTPTKSVFFNYESQEWLVKDRTIARSFKPATFVFGHTLYTASGSRSDPSMESLTLTDLTQSWQPHMKQMPHGVQKSASVVLPNTWTVLVIGGFTEDNKTDDRVLSWTLGADWIYLPSLHTGRVDHCAVVDDAGTVWVLGGETETNGKMSVLASVEQYDSKSEQWAPGEPLPVAVFGHTCAWTHGHIVVMGGSNDEFSRLDNIWIYNIKENKWRAATWHLPIPVKDHMSAVIP